MVTRREFLGRVGVGSGLLCLGNTAPHLWAQAAAKAKPGADQPVLVVVELDGGNDGLNTVIPYADPIYQRSRPTLKQPANKVLKLDEHLGLHPAMTGMAKLWEAGQLRVANNVGYPNPNRSHSRALDIWRSGDVAVGTTGWLGRIADQHAELSLCNVGPGAVPLAMRQRLGAAISLDSLDDLRLSATAHIGADDRTAVDPALAQIATRFASTADLSERMARNSAPAAASPVPWNDRNEDNRPTPLSTRLDVVRALLEQDAGFRIFYTSTTGFDTHADQAFKHRRLLTEVSQGISTFLDKLKESGLADRVIVLVFSEFGRRVHENGQQGTDHGAAAPVLLAGALVAGGMLGDPPDLANLDAGDVAFKIDYRDLYASVLKQWLKIDPTPILGARDASLKIV